ncbi:conserved hypothetical protein [Culex quinquefasciatus]|uniref:Uncharacterized protein n=1 Tax=Culex quinquefasciatus TaxID=7176 RepID=B0XL32_CULQU|nr:conserved hypothetical protein [Culex quinquefasciatus]|eukprot:XP_001870354.1 conserved hypothetical protein [Culex quinquefasciatus]
MQLIRYVSLLLLKIHLILTSNSDALDYVARTIDHLASVHSGVFNCIFWDFSAQEPYDNILNDILQSPRLDNVIKYVLNGSYHDALRNLPPTPSLLFLHPGHDAKRLLLKEVLWDTLRLQLLPLAQYTSINFLDITSMSSQQCNVAQCLPWEKVPHPIFFFRDHRQMTKRNISYTKNEELLPFAWNRHWLEETARYLHTKAVELQLDRNKADILLTVMVVLIDIPREFRQLFTSIPLFSRIAVPRDRPLNVAELLTMPFTWPVWALLAAVLVATQLAFQFISSPRHPTNGWPPESEQELAKHLYPESFRNDPILLVICGLERHDLHRAGRWEKIILHSLIVLMFFMSNAFETKIVSMMVSKPAVHKIKTLDDLARSGLKFYEDLENNPHFVNHSVVGNMVVPGRRSEIFEPVPGVAKLWYSEWNGMVEDLAFDYERMQPFYVLIDYEHFSGPEVYIAYFRCKFMEAFRYTHITLVEAGLMNLWKQQWKREMRSMYIGRRMRKSIESKVDLNFDDLQPAWMALMVGLSASINKK